MLSTAGARLSEEARQLEHWHQISEWHIPYDREQKGSRTVAEHCLGPVESCETGEPDGSRDFARWLAVDVRWRCDLAESRAKSWWSCDAWRNNWWESWDQADSWEGQEKPDGETEWHAAASSLNASSSLEPENGWQHICEALRRWLSERPHIQKYVDVDGLEVSSSGECFVFPLRGMWRAESYLDESQHGAKHGGDGIELYHGCAVTRLQPILCSTRLVRGGRGVESKKGVCGAELLDKALFYAPPGCLTAFAGERAVQCVFRLRAYRSLRAKQLKGCKQYILRENWCQLEALVLKPWDQEFPHQQRDFHTKADESELPPNEPVQNWSFFKTWAPAPPEFTSTLEEQRRKHGLVLEC